MADQLSARYGDLLHGSYDCVDRIVLNAYFSMGHSPGGFRTWWRRLHGGSDEQLDDTHLMRMAGRFSRRVKGWAAVHGVPVVYCARGERKHLLADEHLATHEVGIGVFLVLVAKAPASIWKVKRAKDGTIINLEKKTEYVNHYSFHVMDPDWGHVTIKMSGHPPFGAQVILNGHDYVACAAQSFDLTFAKEDNCFTQVADPTSLAHVADALSQPAAIGQLSQVCDRWIYSACLCFALDTGEQASSGFTYSYSVYQVEYSRNLLFRNGARMQRIFDAIIDRTRSRLDVPTVRTLFGAKARPHRDRAGGPPRLEVAVSTTRYDLTIFKIHFGRLTLKAYTKGEHVLRVEAITHNTNDLGCGRVVDRFPDIVGRLKAMTERFCTILDCVDTQFLPDRCLDDLPLPSHLGAGRVGGIDLNKPRLRSTLTAVLALAAVPGGFTAGDLAAKVQTLSTGPSDDGYTARQAAYDLRKLRGKQLVHKPGTSRRYHVPADAARTIAALLTLRDQIIAPILAGVRSPRLGRKPSTWTPVDRDYDKIRTDMQTLFKHLGIAPPARAAA